MQKSGSLKYFCDASCFSIISLSSCHFILFNHSHQVIGEWNHKYAFYGSLIRYCPNDSYKALAVPYYSSFMSLHSLIYAFILIEVILPNSANLYYALVFSDNLGEDCPVFENLFEFCQIYAGGTIGKLSSYVMVVWSKGRSLINYVLKLVGRCCTQIEQWDLWHSH